MAMRIGYGQDRHRLGESGPLQLAGVSVPYDRGLIGHSDADVALHALCDAMLGAAGMGDIGECFPDTDPAHHNRDSKEFVREVLFLIRRSGWAVGNVDLTICAEAPKLSPYKKEMKLSLAQLLEVDQTVCNVKAKTHEGTGPVGQGVAIDAYCVVLLVEHKGD